MATSKAKVIEQLAEQDKIIQRIFLSTYAGLTAEQLLKKLGISMPYDLLVQHIKHAKTYYHRLLFLPALKTFNEIIIDQCRVRQDFVQQKMIDYLYSDEAQKGDDEPGAELREQIEQQRQQLLDMNEQLEAKIDHADTIDKAVLKELKGKVQQWHELMDKLSGELENQLIQAGYELPKDFKAQLADVLRHDAVMVKLSKEQLKKHKVKGEPTISQKAVIHILEKGENHG